MVVSWWCRGGVVVVSWWCRGGVVVVSWWWCCGGAGSLKGEDRFPAGPRALLRWFQSRRNRLGRMKKCSHTLNSRSAIGTVV